MAGLHGEIFTQVNLTHLMIADDLIGMALGDHRPPGQDIGAIAGAQRFPDVMLRDQDADSPLAQVQNDFLDIDDGNGIDAGERFVQEHEARFASQGPGDFHAPPFAAR